MNLTKNFTIEELTESPTARRKNFTEQFTPSKEIIKNLTNLSINILQPLREKLNIPIVITSGYRCKRTNDEVGSKDTSQHLQGLAVDIFSPSISNSELFKKIQELNLPYDQLIWEFGNKNNPAWVHVSWTLKPRKQILYIGV